MRFVRRKKEIKEPLIRLEFVTLLWNTNPIFASRIHCRNKRSTDALMAFNLPFSAFQAIPTTTYRLSTLFPFIVDKRKAGWRMFRKMQQIYILTKRTISFQHVWLNCALQLISNPRKIYDYPSTFQNSIFKLHGFLR